jgi:hypothetical protein
LKVRVCEPKVRSRLRFNPFCFIAMVKRGPRSNEAKTRRELRWLKRELIKSIIENSHQAALEEARQRISQAEAAPPHTEALSPQSASELREHYLRAHLRALAQS